MKEYFAERGIMSTHIPNAICLDTEELEEFYE